MCLLGDSSIRCVCSLTLHHAPVGRVGDGVDMGGHFMPLLALVHVHNLLRVDGQVLIGVYNHTEEPGVCLRYKTEEKCLMLKHFNLRCLSVLENNNGRRDGSLDFGQSGNFISS